MWLNFLPWCAAFFDDNIILSTPNLLACFFVYARKRKTNRESTTMAVKSMPSAELMKTMYDYSETFQVQEKMEGLLKLLLVEQPDDPISFLIDHLKNNPTYNPKVLRGIMNGEGSNLIDWFTSIYPTFNVVVRHPRLAILVDPSVEAQCMTQLSAPRPKLQINVWRMTD